MGLTVEERVFVFEVILAQYLAPTVDKVSLKN
jgi:hypothetical protein